MDLGNIAAIADILAATGVIISLGFLAYELRLTRKQSELSNWRDVLQALIDYKGLNNDLEFSAFLERAHQDYGALTPAERETFGLYLEQGIHILGNFIKHNDTVPKKLVGLEGAVYALMRDLMASPGARAWWQDSRPKGRFMPQTYDLVDGILAKFDRSAASSDASSKDG